MNTPLYVKCEIPYQELVNIRRELSALRTRLETQMDFPEDQVEFTRAKLTLNEVNESITLIHGILEKAKEEGEEILK